MDSSTHMSSDTTSHAGRYLTFRLADELYGVRVTAVQEIIGLLPITRLPHSAAFVRGVINLRGKVIPVVDLRVKFDVACEPDTERTCIVVAQVMIDDEAVVIGAIVDEVAEVVDVGIESIEPSPTFGTGSIPTLSSAWANSNRVSSSCLMSNASLADVNWWLANTCQIQVSIAGAHRHPIAS